MPNEPSKIKEWIKAIIYSLAVVIPIRIFLVEAYQIPTSSMEKTLLSGDFLFVNKFIYGPKIPFTDLRLPGFRNVEAQDVIIFSYPRDRSLNYVKRCVAVAGSTLEIKNKKLFVDGEEILLPENGQFTKPTLDQNLVDPRIFPREAAFNRDIYGPIRVPKKGDVVQLNRENFYLYKYVIEYEGHKIAMMGENIYVDGFPTSTYTIQQDYYFGLGDNRDNSEDSRYWGFIPETHILGAPLIIYWSWNYDISLLNIFEKIRSIRWSRIAKPLW